VTGALTNEMRAALRWPERRTVSEWVDQNVVLGSDSAEPGPYRTARTPYVREWQDAAAVPWVHQVTIVASTQVGKTQAALNVLGWVISQDPGPVTWVMPTREDAAEFGENKVQPMVESSPALRAQVTGERFDSKRRQIRFRRCRVLFRSARVPKELAQYPARWLFGDEAGKWPDWTQDEAAPFDLARERTRTFWNHKVYLTSTPKAPGGLISLEFERGDRRRFHVPCPHCGRFQVLSWDRVRWPAHVTSEHQMREERDAWYECERCSGRIVDQHKRAMLNRGRWCPAHVEVDQHVVDGNLAVPQDRAPHRSYHIWAGYSPWLSWWEIVAERLRSEGSPATMQNFVNSWLGEPFVERVEGPSTDLLRACVGGYERGEAPAGVRALVAFVDVQKRFLAYTVRGWGMDRESWLIENGRVDSWPALVAAVIAKAWPRGLILRGVAIDIQGGRAGEVIDFARRYPALVRVFRGVEMDSPIPFRCESIDKHPVTGAPLGLKCWHVSVEVFKDLLSQSIRTGGGGGMDSFHVFTGVDQAYLEEMTAEHKVLQRTGERERERWVKRAGHRENHYWDCEVGCRALAHLLRIDALRQDEGRKLQRPPAKPKQEPWGGRFWRRTR